MRAPTFSLRGAFAALAVLSTPAMAAEGFNQLYGTLNVDVESVEAHGATPAGALPPGALGNAPTGIDVPRRTRVTSNSSNLGFRGKEPLSRDLAVFYQVESAVNVDGGGSNIASRNTAIGLEGGWGSLRVGQWDTPYKTLSGAVDPMYFTGITYTGAIIGTPGFGVGPTTIGAPATSADGKSFAAGPNASFERRQGNSVQYWLPAYGGVTAKLGYSVDEAKTSASPSLTPVDPRIYDASIEYQLKALYVAYAYEQHDDYFGLDALVAPSQAVPVAASGGVSAGSRDRGHKLVARVKWRGTTLGFMGERLEYTKHQGNAPGGSFSRYDRDAFAVTLLQKVGAAGTLRGFIAKASSGTCARFDGSACDTSGLGARQLSLGYSHTLSPRTDVYAFYTRVENDSRATYQFANGAGIGAPAGSASVAYLVGMRHTF